MPTACVLITLASILSSLAITYFISIQLGRPPGFVSLLIAIVAPSVIAPIFSYSLLSTIKKLALAERKLHKLSTIDDLTQVYNRRHILELAEAERVKALQQGYPLSLALLDIDLFKKVNDIHGHAAGDKVLQQFAALCQRHCRGIDHFARYGGDEFIIVMPKAGPEHAREFVSRLRQIIANSAVSINDVNIFSTVSIGVATLEASENLEALLLRTDRALFQAKYKGKNTVACAAD
ncbi:MAG: GGDEF domain-containing protein, partial [Gammaproteobacteria bacterium]|nr:GGDEF domain-containing protein [Gammaproteobacteria bacterium]